MMIIGCVPLYNVMAVVVLAAFAPEKSAKEGKGDNAPGTGSEVLSKKGLAKKTLFNIVSNPLIIGIALGFLWSALKLPMPQIMNKTLSSVGGVSTPLGLIAMGATFDLKKAFEKGFPSVVAALIKLLGFAAVLLPLAISLGFRKQELVAILVMLGSATTVSSYVMAKNMGHEGTLTSSIVMLTTLFSALTLTMWLYLLKTYQLI